VFQGFSGSISDAARAGLLGDGRVRTLEPDQTFSIDAGGGAAASWGLDRVDQRTTPLNQTYNYLATGSGVTAYVVDTGIRYSHNDFGGRARPGYDAFGGDGSDCQGHGTHVAGTVGGSTYGVAKQVSLVSVRVMNCTGSGSTSTIVAGLDWILANASRPAVVNMSLGGSGQALVDAAVLRIIQAGVPVVAAAGNATADACQYSPARVPEVLTIGGTGENDARASWSNWGVCLDLFAPGVSIPSAGHSGDDAVAVKSGTSMASPHVAGAAALYLDTHPGATPQDVAAALAAWSTKGVVGGSFSASSDLLYALDDGTDGSGGNVPPVAEFWFSCEGLTCQFLDNSSDPDGAVEGWQWDFGDKTGSLDRNPVHVYPVAGTYRVALIVRDTKGVTTARIHDVAVCGATLPPPPGNAAPVAAFNVSCSALSCDFQDASSDADGIVTGWSWEFGDGSTSNTQNPKKTFGASGTYQVTLRVTDDKGASASAAKQVTVQNANSLPAAQFTVSCSGLACTFTDLSSDSDGTIASRTWDFGDGTPALAISATSPSHTYSQAGTYSVRLTVTDDRGGTGTASLSVATSGISLSVNGVKEKGQHRVTLVWSGSSASEIDVYLDGAKIGQVLNSGTYLYTTTARGRGVYAFRVCEAGTSVCSAEATYKF
jgi:PKD repeat protein